MPPEKPQIPPYRANRYISTPRNPLGHPAPIEPPDNNFAERLRLGEAAFTPSHLNALRYGHPAALRSYKLFISHAWDYSAHYEDLSRLLDGCDGFHWTNLSIPQASPVSPHPRLNRSYRALIRELDEKIRQADCVLVIAAMYVSHSNWIQSEIEAALEMQKPIIAVAPWGQERIPKEIQFARSHDVRWNRESIVKVIRSAC